MEVTNHGHRHPVVRIHRRSRNRGTRVHPVVDWAVNHWTMICMSCSIALAYFFWLMQTFP